MSELNDDMWEQIELNNYGKGKLVHIVNEQAELIRSLYEQLDSAHRDATEEVAKAHKRGWEQAKVRIAEMIKQQSNDQRYTPFEMRLQFSKKLTDAIAAMEYGGKAND